MNRDDFIEKFIGGIFAVIAVCAAVVELFLLGISPETIAACIKDVFGTLAVVILFLAVMKDFLPGWSFKSVLSDSLSEWEMDNSNMIVRKTEHDKGEHGQSYYSLDMKTDVSDFYNTGTHKKTGLFVRMPILEKNNYRNKFEITFTLNKALFFGDIPESEIKADDYKNIANRFIDLLNTNYKDVVRAENGKNPKEITVKFSNGLNKKSDIATFIDVINTMYTSYLVSARIKK